MTLNIFSCFPFFCSVCFCVYLSSSSIFRCISPCCGSIRCNKWAQCSRHSRRRSSYWFDRARTTRWGFALHRRTADITLFCFQDGQLTPLSLRPHVSASCFQVTNTVVIDSAKWHERRTARGIWCVRSGVRLFSEDANPDAEMNTSREGCRSNEGLTGRRNTINAAWRLDCWFGNVLLYKCGTIWQLLQEGLFVCLIYTRSERH